MLRLLKLLFGINSQLSRDEINSNVEPVNFETDPIRFQYDACIKEFELISEQLHLRVQLTDRVVDFFFILLAALISAANLFSNSVNLGLGSINRFPVVYLILAVVSLWFSVSHLNHIIYSTALGRYIELVLSPKLSHIAYILSKDERSGELYWQWEFDRFPEALHGAIRWEAFRSSAYKRSTGMLISFVAGFRSLVYFAPTVIFLTIFLNLKSSSIFWIDWTIAEKIVTVTLVIVASLLAVGFWLTQREVWFSPEQVMHNYKYQMT